MIKHCWEKLKQAVVSREIYAVHGLKDFMLLRCAFPPNWSVVAIESQSKSK